MVFPGTDLLFLALSVFAGWLLASRFTLGLSPFERFIVGAIGGVAFSTWAAYLASLALGSMSAPVLTLSLSALLAALLVLCGRVAVMGAFDDAAQLWHGAASNARKNPIPFLTFIVLGVFFAFLYANAWFPTDSTTGAISSAGYVWGDGPFHLTVANSFLKADNFPPAYPIIAGKRLGYPFLSDFQAAALLALGASTQTAFALSGWLELMLALVAVFLLAKRVTNSAKVATASVLLLVFNGGLGFLSFAAQWVQGGLTSALQLAGSSDLARVPATNELFTNFVTSVFLPQRPASFGLAAIAAVLLVLYAILPLKQAARGVSNALRAKRLTPVLVFAGVLAGSTVLFHAHSVLALLIVLGLFLFVELVSAYRESGMAGAKSVFSSIVPFAVPLVIVGLPQALWSLPQLGSASFVRVQPFWLANSLNPLEVLAFWANNAGPFLLLALLGIYWKRDDFVKWAWPFAALWLFANFVILQPYDYDNLKLLLVAQAGLAVLAALALQKLWNAREFFRNPPASVSYFFRFIAVLFFIAAIATGVLSVAWQSQRSNVLFTPADVQFASQFDAVVPASASVVTLTGATHNHPVTALDGRSVVMGYRGWLWTHGFDYAQREADVTTMFAATNASQTKALLAAYNVSYVVIGPDENEFNPNAAFYAQYSLVLEAGGRKVYKVA